MLLREGGKCGKCGKCGNGENVERRKIYEGTKT